MKINKKDLKRFRQLFREGDPSACWDWKGNIAANGYGRVYLDGKYTYAHRVAYLTSKGKIKNHIDHLCRNRRCVNPNHLEDVTCRENVLRGIGPAAQNARKTHCPQGHEYDMLRVRKDRPNPMRGCTTCRRESTRRWRKKSS